jgi:hypothetical protein
LRWNTVYIAVLISPACEITLPGSQMPGFTWSKGGDVMRTVFIKFSTQDDRARGFYELATKATIGSFPDEIYQVPIESLKMLDDQHIEYRRATAAEVKAANDQVRNPAPAVL